MQNRPDLLGLTYLEHKLDEDFPLLLVPDFRKSDAPVTALHFHNCSEIGFCQSGSGVLIVGEKVMPYQSGDVTFIAQGEPHISRSADGTFSQWSWIMFDPLRLLPGAKPVAIDPMPYAGKGFRNIFSPADHPNLQASVRKVIAECAQRLPHWDSAVRALIWEIMIIVSRSGQTGDYNLVRRPLNRIAPALEALAGDYADRWTVKKLADLCAMSESNFRRVWTNSMGQSPQEYLILMRMQMAAAILRSSDQPVTEVSMAVGFESLSSFNRLFRRHFQCTPLQWRNHR